MARSCIDFGSGTSGTRRWTGCERVRGGRFVRLAPHLGLVNGGGPGVEVGEGVLFRGRIMNLGSNTLSLSYPRDLRRQLAHGAGAKERNLAQKYKSRSRWRTAPLLDQDAEYRLLCAASLTKVLEAVCVFYFYSGGVSCA